MAWSDETTHHVMRSHVQGEGYATLMWPKNATVRELTFIREVTNLQIDSFIRDARRVTERQEAGETEYASWLVLAAQTPPAHRSTT